MPLYPAAIYTYWYCSYSGLWFVLVDTLNMEVYGIPTSWGGGGGGGGGGGIHLKPPKFEHIFEQS